MDFLFSAIKIILRIIIEGGASLVKLLVIFTPVVILLILLYHASNYFQNLQIKVLGFSKAIWFFAPGIALHEASHFLACVLTGAPVGRVVLFTPRGERGRGGRYTLGFVEHGNPSLPGGDILIALAPFIGISIVLVIGVKLLLPAFTLPPLYAATSGGIAAVPFDYTFKILGSGWALLKSMNWLDIKTYLFLYLMLAAAPGIAPSKEDFRTFWKGVAILFGFLFCFLVLITMLDVNIYETSLPSFFIRQSAILSSYLSLSLICTLLGMLIFHVVLYLQQKR